jgi:hypothetical protein
MDEQRTVARRSGAEVFPETLLRALSTLSRADPDELDELELVLEDLVVEEILDALTTRPLDGVTTDEVYVEVTRLEPCDSGGSSSVVATATGVGSDGRPEPLGAMAASRPSSNVAAVLLVSLRARGLRGVRRVTSSPGTDLAAVVGTVFPGAGWVPLTSQERPAWLSAGPR